MDHVIYCLKTDSGKCHKQATGKRKVEERSKKMLVEALTTAGVIFQQNQNHAKKNFKSLQEIKYVYLFEDKQHVAQGWEGQPNAGLMQVLWERGLINT